MNKIFAIIVIAVVIVGGYFLIKKGAPKSGTTVSETSNNEVSSQSSASQAQIAEEKIITYTDTGYSPSSIQIKQGGTIIFKNESSQSMWPASSMHPTHKDYPTTGGCLGSTFDACKGVQPGDSWSFKFDIAGNWKYHDHLSPKSFGIIIVQQ